MMYDDRPDDDSTRYYAEEADSPGHTEVYADDGGAPETLDKRLDLRNHSPSGFSWGYGGSGPAQLSLAILADYYNDQIALDHYRQFNREVVSKHPQDTPFTVDDEEIELVVGIHREDV